MALPSTPDSNISQKPHIDDTEVTQWLRKNGATESLVKAFHNRGYRTLDALDADDIKAMVAQPGLLKELLLALKRAQEQKAEVAKKAEEAKKVEKKVPMLPPTLPKGETFDLSQQQVAFDNVTFEIPKALSVDTVSQMRLADQLSDTDWVVLAKRSLLLYGYSMSEDPEARPDVPVLYWKVPKTDRFFKNEAWHATVTSEVAYTHESASYVRAGFDKESASASYVFCSASFERTHKERSARAQEVKRCYMTGHYRYPRASLLLDECTVVSDEFTAAVETALEEADPAAALGGVLEQYGYAVPKRVLLGGELLYINDSEDVATAEDHQVEDQFSAAVKASGKGLSGDAGVATGSASRDSSASQRLQQNMSFSVVGGQTLYDTNPQQWVPTLADPLTWAVIGRSALISTLDLLKPPLRDRAKSYWKPKIPFPERQPVLPEKENVLASQAGFVSGMVEVTGDAADSVLRAYGGRDSAPGEVRAAAPIHFWKTSRLRRSGLLLPVPRGEYWRLARESSVGDTSETIFWQPVPFEIGAWVPVRAQDDSPDALALNRTCRREGDGFVMVTATVTGNGTRGTVVARQAIDDVEETKLTDVTATSLHYWEGSDIKLRGASLLMPVRRGHEFRLDVAWMDPQRARIDAWWIPLQPGWRLGPVERRSAGDVNKAQSNGLLFGFIQAADSLLFADGAEAVIEVVDENARTIVRLTQGTAELAAMRDRFVPYTSLACIVRQGERYICRMVSGSTGSLSLFWVPFQQE